MKKGDLLEGIVSRVDYPGKGIVAAEEGDIAVKNVLPGQRVRLRVTKKRRGKAEGTVQEVLEKAPEERTAPCPHFGSCGGCTYLNLPEKEESSLKCAQVLRLLEKSMREAAQLAGMEEEEYKRVLAPTVWFEGILDSPLTCGYRNKMEFTFGDSCKDGPLALGMHRRGSFYDIVTVDGCVIADPDFSLILRTVLSFFQELSEPLPFYHRLRHEGYLRHLLVRRAAFTGEILIDLVTTTQYKPDLSGLVDRLLTLQQGSPDTPRDTGSAQGERLRGRIVGILHTSNDSLADVIADQGTEILYGTDHFTEELLGLRFTVTPFSFFQTNSHGAQVLYETARRFLTEAGADAAAQKLPVQENSAGKGAGKPPLCGIIYDLYCGTGTIAQVMAPYAEKVIGVEIVEEAVRAAKENARLNGLSNCEFIAGDVLKVLDGISPKPDTIILDPPRDGIHPKALPRIISFGVENILYISCKPTSLARDLPAFIAAGYRPVRAVCVNQFPWTTSVETVVLLSNKKCEVEGLR